MRGKGQEKIIADLAHSSNEISRIVATAKKAAADLAEKHGLGERVAVSLESAINNAIDEVPANEYRIRDQLPKAVDHKVYNAVQNVLYELLEAKGKISGSDRWGLMLEFIALLGEQRERNK